MKDNTFILVPGAFNPPTIAHIKMGEMLCRLYPEADVTYLPSRDEYITGWKGQFSPIPYSHRVELLYDATKYLDCIGICTVEQNAIHSGKTYNTVNWFKSNFKGFDIIICLGEDKLKELPRWYKYEQLISENRFIIMTRDKSRDTFPLELLPYADNFEFLDFDYPDISSTKIREAYLSRQLDTVREFIPHNVYKYLQTYKDLFKEVDTNV